MEDLSGIAWAAPTPAIQPPNQQPGPKGNYYPTLRPTAHPSGASNPLAAHTNSHSQKASSNASTGSKLSTSANDSFANLVSFTSSQSTKSLSLQEQQRLLQEQKAKQEDERRRQFDAQSGSNASPFVSHTKGNGATTPSRAAYPPTYTATQEYGGQKLSRIINKPFAGISNLPQPTNSKASAGDDDDLLAAFSADAPVDKSSHMPAVLTGGTSHHLGGLETNGADEISRTSTTANGFHVEDDDDDPFGLGTTRSAPRTELNGKVDKDVDDILGLLSRPVSEFSKPPPVDEQAPPTPPAENANPQDAAIAELVDMGFPAEKSRMALENTESGTDVQAAVGWLLNQAHEESRKEKPRKKIPGDTQAEEQRSKQARARRKSSGASKKKPAWMREQAGQSASHSGEDAQTGTKADKDAAQLASEIGNNLFKTANSLWKTGTKKLNQAVSDFNSDSDSNQPKWMRDTNPQATSRRARSPQRGRDATDHDKSRERRQKQSRPQVDDSQVTDEALMLEARDSRPQPQKPSKEPKAAFPTHRPESPREQPPQRTSRVQQPTLHQPRSMQQVPLRGSVPKLSRQAVEEEAAQAYISPARRKKSAPKSAPLTLEPDLLFDISKPASQVPAPEFRPTPVPSPRPSTASPLRTRPSPPKRAIPALSPSSLQSSTASRQAGTAAFKRGDYAQATTCYSRSLSALPKNHPLIISVLTNRTLAHLKTGDPKAAIADATTVLELIGPTRGVGENIDLGAEEGVKSMDSYWGKAMTRKAEAFEQLERWNEAAAAWRACVEFGVGGATSIAGRNRCENALKPNPPAAKRPPPRPTPRPSAFNDLTPSDAQSAEAVARLRAANAAADKIDDEKFALADQVDARVKKWRTGKEGNLRALLSSLENVLWESSGWKKVGMGDLLLPGKVKIVYMKGIAKVHPDKLPPTATTEQKMISAAVFATLNEAWERFKLENGL